MDGWQIGEVTVTRLVERELTADFTGIIPDATPEAIKAIPWLVPNYASEEGELRLSFHALLVEAPGLRLVVDTCFGNDKERSTRGAGALQTSFLQDFEALGWTRESVDFVMCTHLHLDHVGWNTMLVEGVWVPTFPSARYLISQSEYAYWRDEEDDEEQRRVFNDSVKPVFDAGLVDLVEPDHAISDEIRLIPSHGHTPGHVSVLIESGGETALITGDFVHNPCQMAHPEWGTNYDADIDEARETRMRMLEEYVDGPVLIIGTHFAAPTAGHIIRDGNVYRFRA